MFRIFGPHVSPCSLSYYPFNHKLCDIIRCRDGTYLKELALYGVIPLAAAIRFRDTTYEMVYVNWVFL